MVVNYDNVDDNKGQNSRTIEMMQKMMNKWWITVRGGRMDNECERVYV